MKTAFVTGLILFCATAAVAHSPLHSTQPAQDARITSPPVEIVMGFKGDIRLTRVTLTHGDAAIDLDLDGFDGFVSDYAIPVQTMGPGLHEVAWRGLGDDGHPMNGSFSFTVEAE